MPNGVCAGSVSTIIGARSYGSIQSILKHGLDRRPPKPARQGELLPTHPNIRGSRYSH
jgi:hypothetical protein